MCKELQTINSVKNVIQLLRRESERCVGVLELGEATKPADKDTESLQGGKQVLMR